MKQRFAMSLALVLVASAVGLFWWYQHAQESTWTTWEGYKKNFVAGDGRVIDKTAGDRTTSEGQAYTLFFALVNNDKPLFDLVLKWTNNNLAEGQLGEKLPAWQWGRKGDNWGILDKNSASDADLWFIYTLMEAGRYWKNPQYIQVAQKMLLSVKQYEVYQRPFVGSLLFPGSEGFLRPDGTSKLNPSYVPEFQFRYLAKIDPEGHWLSMSQTFFALVREAAPKGFYSDWFLLTEQGRVVSDDESQSIGSYDAIRVYLWAGLTFQWQESQRLLTHAQPFLDKVRQAEAPFEYSNTQTGQTWGYQPIGFYAALLPWLQQKQETKLLNVFKKKLKEVRNGESLGNPPHYYDQVLALFGEGWIRRQYQFDDNGQVILQWATNI
jgi:endoglucanase